MRSRKSPSLGRRLAWGAAGMIAVALVVAGIGISAVLHRFVIGQVDQRLDGQIAAIASALVSDGSGIRLSRSVDAPPFDRTQSGWYWEVRDEDGMIIARAPSLGSSSIDVLQARFHWQEFWNLRPRPADGRGPGGQPLHLRVGTAMAGAVPVSVIASAPADAVLRPLGEALAPVLFSLLLLGVCLAVASLVQVRLGLRPLRQLRQSLADVRAGRSAHVPSDQLAELMPLTDELNVLLDQNVQGLERARRNVANLAHSLKTPLATLAVMLQQSKQPGDAALLVHVEQMERHIRHHLSRARAAALNGPARMRIEIAPRLADLAALFGKVYADKGIAYSAAVPSGMELACEPQDLDEMLGNVLDNAFKWARSRVETRVEATDGHTSITIVDDGPGLADDQVPEALLPGRRLDETTPGHGFGLAIVRELAELYNGSVSLSRSRLGGLGVTIALPLARG